MVVTHERDEKHAPVAQLVLLTLLTGCTWWRGRTDFEIENAPTARMAVFTADATPPLGHPMDEGLDIPPRVLEVVDDPLLIKGIVLEQNGSRYVIAAVDWGELRTGAHDLLRRKLAAAAATDMAHVPVHAHHQHPAPAGA